MKNPTLSILTGLLITGLLLGCAAPTTPPADNSDSTNTTPPADTPAETQNPPTDGTPSDSTDFSELFGARSTLNAKAVYAIQMSPAQADVNIAGYTYYFKTGKYRVDVSAQTSYGTFNSRMYAQGFQEGASIVTCTTQTDDWTCYQMTYDPKSLEQQGQTQTPLEKDVSNDSNYTTVLDGSETRAGLTGACFKATKNGDDPAYYSRYCITAEGIPVYVKGITKDSTIEMELTSAQLNVVTDADFVYPATPKELGDTSTGSANGSGGVDASVCDSLTGANKEQCLQAFG